jgi:hypothetical protein
VLTPYLHLSDELERFFEDSAHGSYRVDVGWVDFDQATVRQVRNDQRCTHY